MDWLILIVGATVGFFLGWYSKRGSRHKHEWTHSDQKPFGEKNYRHATRSCLACPRVEYLEWISGREEHWVRTDKGRLDTELAEILQDPDR